MGAIYFGPLPLCPPSVARSEKVRSRWGAVPVGGPEGGEPKPRRGGRPQGVEARFVGARNCTFFAFSSPAPPISALFSFWVSFREILVVFKALEPSNVHVWSSRVVV